ncbi:MAG: cytochrome c biogenesis CcdA family protein [Candidatus Heteroscillospira sp.]|jgi:cytochrome c-type biogenesis protein
MEILIVIAQGFFTFAAPCHLPLLPVLMMLFSGSGEGKAARCFKNTFLFTLGITASFCVMGAVAGSLGSVLEIHGEGFDVVCGVFMIVMGVLYSGLLPFKLPHFSWLPQLKQGMGGAACMVFGVLFSLSFLPCSGALWASAMLVASHTGSALGGIFVMLAYSAGICVPFLVAALLTDKVKNTVKFVKRHTRAMNLCAAVLLIVFGVLMATGMLDTLLGHHH